VALAASRGVEKCCLRNGHGRWRRLSSWNPPARPRPPALGAAGRQPPRGARQGKAPPAVAGEVWSCRCWLRVRCHCAALLVLC
jgi:hypothetical protein